MKVAAIQLEQVSGGYQHNLTTALALSSAALRDGAELLVLPELFATGYLFDSVGAARAVAQPQEGEIFQRLLPLAQQFGATIVYGYLEHDPSSDTLHNAASAINSQGILARYRKVHPYVSDTIWAVDGARMPPRFFVGDFTATMMICADIEFPELSSYHQDVDLICLPTAWVDEKAPSSTWWARSKESHAHLVAADLCGTEFGVVFSGGSAVLSPHGEVLATLDFGSGIVSAEIQPRAPRSGAPKRCDDALWLSTASFELPELTRRVPRAFGGSALGNFSVAFAQTESFDLSQEGIALFCERVTTDLAGPATKGTLLLALPASSVELDESAAPKALEELAKHLTENIGASELVVSWYHQDASNTYRWIASSLSGVRRLGEAAETTVMTNGTVLAVLGAKEIQDWELTRRLSLEGCQVLLVSGEATSPTWPVTTRAPSASGLAPFGENPSMNTSSITRIRAGENNLVVALSCLTSDNDTWSLGGVYGPDHISYPYYEVTCRANHVGAAILSFDVAVAPSPHWTLERRPYLRRRKPWLYAH